jgi:hypothetical protein
LQGVQSIYRAGISTALQGETFEVDLFPSASCRSPYIALKSLFKNEDGHFSRRLHEMVSLGAPEGRRGQAGKSILGNNDDGAFLAHLHVLYFT